MDSFQLQNFVPGFAPVRNNLRLSGAEPHTVVDADRAGVERDGAGDGVEVDLGISCPWGEGSGGVGVGARGPCQGVFPLARDGPLRRAQAERISEVRLRWGIAMGVGGGAPPTDVDGADAPLPSALDAVRFASRSRGSAE